MLRKLSVQRLWDTEVMRFNAAPPGQRAELVGIVRAVGTILAEKGTTQQQAEARKWLRSLLEDPEEKVRRYAVQALPKLGGGVLDESDLLDLLQSSKSEREKKHVTESLSKIGGKGSLSALEDLDAPVAKALEQRVKATVARRQTASRVLTDKKLTGIEEQRIILHCRSGLEPLVEEELTSRAEINDKFSVLHSRRGRVTLSVKKSCSYADLLLMRCHSEASFQLGTTKVGDTAAAAALIAGPASYALFQQMTEGPLRYRIEPGETLTKAQLKDTADRVFQQRPELLNDSREAPWQITLHLENQRWSVELSPRLRPDPRFSYRVHDVPASSHPPLAAAMARVAQVTDGESVWDPFCGSGVELIECAKLAKLRAIYGTDLNGNAVVITKTNLQAAKVECAVQKIACTDFRHAEQVLALGQRSVGLIISNPPLGKRVPVPELRELMQHLFYMASHLLASGGRMVLINPVSGLRVPQNLKRSFQQQVDLGGFTAMLERYRCV